FTVLARQSNAFAASTPKAIGSPSPGEVAITVDDIPEHGALVAGFTRQSVSEQIIRALHENGAVGSRGFATGEFFDDRPEEIHIFKLWLDAGFPLGNHTYHHFDLSHVSAHKFIRDVEQEDRLLTRLQGTSPLISDRYVFRYPYLDEGNALAKRNAV